MIAKGLYAWGITGGYALLYPWLRKKYALGFDERRGLYGDELKALGSQKPLWIHGVSVGEVQSAAPLVEAMHREELPGPLLFSTITPTGRRMGEMLLGSKVDRFFYYPWDVPRIVRKALSTLGPRMYITLETEVWPSLLEELSRRNIPAFLVNGRFSDRTLARGKRWKKFYCQALNRFEKLFLRSEEERSRALLLGVEPHRIRITGENKAGAVLQRKRQKPEDLPPFPEGPPIFLGGSTHPGEEAVLLRAYEELRRRGYRSRLILVPRHPERAPEVFREARKISSSVRLLTECAGEEPWEILVVDRIGVLFHLYSQVRGAFVGGSLVPRGGQNLMEPAAWGIPVQHGPHMEDFARIAGDLEKLGCSREISSCEDLLEDWLACLENPSRREEARKGIAYVESLDGAAGKAWEEIREYL
ncbi:MAG TPA: glycosyltransferase N-terminal domain-containing protein [Synergistaceae bacterium]|nr:glycosyltransferase N-terminal domain-containing protein [Synergistaceae bacterium]HPJ24658.1 glycosyltransferase N-terminal domain-containing protein [Synergistaceae bacterium]HPQ37060.1 glycosyltransferase N-terminal domain-containing protein [Synergistaceae bacterium]